MTILPSPKRGRLRIPPLPQFTVFVDRDDGTEWVLSHSDEPVEGITPHVSINDAALERGSLPPRVDAIVYPADNGANMGKGIQLFVRGGRLGYEVVDYVAYNSPPQTRIGVVRECYEIVIPADWTYPAALAFNDESVI